MGDRTRMERGAQGATDTVAEADTGTEATHGTTFTNAGPIPPVMGFPQQADTQSASDIAFGVDRNGVRKREHKDDGTIEAVERRTQAQRLLLSEKVTSGQEAIAALDILLSIDESQRAAAIDHLDAKAFQNLCQRLEDSERIRLAALVTASQDPKRKLQLWRAQHLARAHEDLNRYKGDFGEPDRGMQTDEQQSAQLKYERRERGVKSTEGEVQTEVDALLAKGDALTVADVDAMRARKDVELGVEMKHNINLTAEPPRKGQEQVQWTGDDVAQLDASLSKLPDAHVHDENSVETYERRANYPGVTRGGEYVAGQIDVYDNARNAPPDRPLPHPVEYSVTHEVGHKVETENKAAFAKFEKAAGWKEATRSEVEKQGASDEDIAYMGDPKQVGDKMVHKDDQGKFYEVDRTAIPSEKEQMARAQYSLSNSHEHFAELYAMAVETPELLYADYIEQPADDLLKARNAVRDQSAVLQKTQPGSADHQALLATLENSKQALAVAEKTARQRRELFEIIRNDIFHGDKGTRAAVARLKQQGASDTTIRTFEENGARVSTPQQLEALERQAMR